MRTALKVLGMILTAAACAFPGASPARAQTCGVPPYEVIVTVKAPVFGVPTVWDAPYGAAGTSVRFASGVPQKDGTVMAVGRRVSKDDPARRETVLADINRRGRVLKEASVPAKDGEMPVKMMAVKGGFLVVSNMAAGRGLMEKQVRLSWYDSDGRYRRDAVLKDPVFDYEARALLPAADGGGFIAVVHAVNRKADKDRHGLVMRFGESGALAWKRAYRPGIPNEITGMIPVDETSYLASGSILMDDGRVAGWAMKLGYDGTVLWQRTYPRGRYSVLRRAGVSRESTAEGHEFVLTGDARPTDGGPDSAWIMSLDANGNPLWQRYYRRPDMTLSGGWVAGNGDGRTTVVVNAKAEDGSGQQDHIRIFTLSSQGALINDESYITGLRAQARDFTGGWNGERVLIADADIVEEDVADAGEEGMDIYPVYGPPRPPAAPGEKAKKPEPESRGWIAVATALDPYTDPCTVRRPAAVAK